MWLDEDLPGCIYDTVDCYGTCPGCHWGRDRVEEEKDDDMGMATTGHCPDCGELKDLSGKEPHNCKKDFTYTGVEGFVHDLHTTVRECIDCGCLTPGGPTRCKRCAKLVKDDDEFGSVTLTDADKTTLSEHDKRVIREIGCAMPPSKAAKFDGEKVDWTHMPWSTMEQIMRVYMMGAKKYSRGNYLHGLHYSRFFSAAIRHMTAWWELEETDSESGLNHLAHAAWNIITLLEYETRGTYREFDDRAAHEPLIQALDKDLDDLSKGKEPSTGTLKVCGDGGCAGGCDCKATECDHHWVWHSQWTDTVGIHVVSLCTKCRAQQTTDYGIPPREYTVSVPSMWIDDPTKGVIPVTVTSSHSAENELWIQMEEAQQREQSGTEGAGAESEGEGS